VGEEAIFLPAQKCSYHVTFDLDREHTLDARWPGVHRVQVWWRSGHLSARIDGGCKFSTLSTLWTNQLQYSVPPLSRAGEVTSHVCLLAVLTILVTRDYSIVSFKLAANYW